MSCSAAERRLKVEWTDHVERPRPRLHRSIDQRSAFSLRLAAAAQPRRHQTSSPPAKVSPAPTLQKIIRSPSLKIPSSAAQPSAIETLAALVLPYLEMVTTNLS